MKDPDAKNGRPESGKPASERNSRVSRGGEKADRSPGEGGPATAAATDKVDIPGGLPDVLPILPTRGVAVFPGIISSLSIGRPGSRRLLEQSLPQSKVVGLVAQKDPELDAPTSRDLYRIGVAVAVLKLLRQPD